GEARAKHPAWHQAHAGGVGHDLAGHRQGHHGAAVVAAGEGDDAGPAGGGAGNLHRVFQGLGAGGDQQRLLGEGTRHQRIDALAQFHIGLVGHHLETGVGVQLQLTLYRLDHLRVTVAGVEHGDAAGKVDVLAPFHIPDGRVLGALDEDRVDLPHTTGYGLLTPLHEGFVAIYHVTAPSPSDTAKTQVFYFQVLI